MGKGGKKTKKKETAQDYQPEGSLPSDNSAHQEQQVISEAKRDTRLRSCRKKVTLNEIDKEEDEKYEKKSKKIIKNTQRTDDVNKPKRGRPPKNKSQSKIEVKVKTVEENEQKNIVSEVLIEKNNQEEINRIEQKKKLIESEGKQMDQDQQGQKMQEQQIGVSVEEYENVQKQQGLLDEPSPIPEDQDRPQRISQDQQNKSNHNQKINEHESENNLGKQQYPQKEMEENQNVINQKQQHKEQQKQIQ